MPLIDKEKLQISLMRIGCYDIADIVEDQPEVDAVPVMHAYWLLYDTDDFVYRYECTKCRHILCRRFNCRENGNPVFNEMNLPKYCSNCGAKMDGEQK